MSSKARFRDRHAIKAEIHRRGSSLSAIARDAGLDDSTTRKALRERMPAGEAAIAAFLGVSPSDLWPDRYAACPSPTSHTATTPGLPGSRKRVAA
jgi:Ner family transcriptional regulator